MSQESSSLFLVVPSFFIFVMTCINSVVGSSESPYLVGLLKSDIYACHSSFVVDILLMVRPDRFLTDPGTKSTTHRSDELICVVSVLTLFFYPF